METLSAKEKISQEQETEIQQMRMFGCTTEQIKKEFDEARNKKIYLMGIISDAQEMSAYYEIEFSKTDSEKQYQLLNKAKYIIDNFMEIK